MSRITVVKKETLCQKQSSQRRKNEDEDIPDADRLPLEGEEYSGNTVVQRLDPASKTAKSEQGEQK